MYDIEKALKILQANISTIRTVSQWAGKVGYRNQKKFSRDFRKEFGTRPKQKLIEIRLQKFKKCLRNDSTKINYSIAKEVGLDDEFALYKFLKRHTDLSPTEWRKRIVKADSQNR